MFRFLADDTRELTICLNTLSLSLNSARSRDNLFVEPLCNVLLYLYSRPMVGFERWQILTLLGNVHVHIPANAPLALKTIAILSLTQRFKY